MPFENEFEMDSLYPFGLQTDSDGRIQFVGRGIKRFLSTSSDDLYFLHEFKFIRPALLSDFSNHVSAAPLAVMIEHIQSGLQLRGVCVAKNPGVWFLVIPCAQSETRLEKYNLSPSDFSPEDPISGYVTLIDKQKRMVSELQRLNSRNELLARFPDEDPNPILRINKKGQILYQNQSAIDTLEKMDARSREDLMKFLLEAQQKIRQDNRPTCLEIHLHGKDFKVTMRPIDHLPYINVYIADITDETVAQRHLEQQKIQLSHQSRLAALGEMAGGIAHEINNPLAIMKGSILHLQRLLTEDIYDLGKINAILERMDRTCLRVAKIISGLKSYSRDGVKDPYQMVALKTIFETTLSLCFEKFRVNGIELYTEGDESTTLECQQVQMSQVLLNLLNNSFDAIVGTTNPWVKITSHLDDKGSIQITVTDSGSGIPKNIQNRIMDPFFTTKEVGKGAGLGLSVSKGIIESHHGSLKIDSENPQTCFVISMPRRQPKIEKSGKFNVA